LIRVRNIVGSAALLCAACAVPLAAAAQSVLIAAAPADPRVSATVVPGTQPYPNAPSAAAPALRPGPVSINLSGVEVHVFARAVLGEILGLPFAVDPAVKGQVSLVTPHPVSRADAIPAVEEALAAANLALVLRGGVYTILPMEAAKGQPSAGAGPGFGTEVVALKFANPDQIKRLLDPVVPNVITATDPAARTVTLSGISGQRRAARALISQFDVDWMRGMSFGLFIPKTTDARLIGPELEKLINAPGATTAGLVRLIPMERLNGIIAVATRPEYLEDVRRWVEVLDREGMSSERRLYVYRVQNGRAIDLADVLVAAFGGEAAGGASGSSKSASGSASSASGMGAKPPPMSLAPGEGATAQAAPHTLPGQSPAPAAGHSEGSGLVVTADETNNAVIAYATPREYALIEDALSKLDVPPLQVVIEAAITEVTLNDTLRYGTQWFFQEHGNQLALSEGSTAQPVQNFPGAAYTVFTNGYISATISALSTVTHVQVLSAPNLMVLNNQTATLQVGDQVPIATGSSVSTVAANAPVVNSIDYRDTGVILKVTPRVNSSGLVLLDISQEVSQVAPVSKDNPIDSPVIQERKIASSIAVRDGQTIALGGLISDNNSRGRTGVPYLSAIPILGALAGNRDNSRVRTELLVLLSPRVIRTAEQAQEVSDEIRSKIREATPRRPRIEP
jgi:general secretion pathway protein D